MKRGKKVISSERDVLNWASQLADALTYLHGQNPQLSSRHKAQ
jgi:hypothetical protein